MSDSTVLNTVRLPARVDTRQTGQLLNFEEHSIRVLVQAGLLKPLGDPPANAPKFFAADEVERLAHDRVWLSKATKVITEYWRGKNARRTQRQDVI